MKVINKKGNYKPYNKVNNNNVVIMWDYKPIFKNNSKGEQIETPLASWQEYRFNYIPTLDEIKNVIFDFYNKETDEKIISGHIWNGMNVWLSSENQFNYKVAYDIAVQTNGGNLPVKFKFGTDNNAIYYEFKTLEELFDFYVSSINYVQKTLEEGWQKKDSINWNFYK